MILHFCYHFIVSANEIHLLVGSIKCESTGTSSTFAAISAKGLTASKHVVFYDIGSDSYTIFKKSNSPVESGQNTAQVETDYSGTGPAFSIFYL